MNPLRRWNRCWALKALERLFSNSQNGTFIYLTIDIRVSSGRLIWGTGAGEPILTKHIYRDLTGKLASMLVAAGAFFGGAGWLAGAQQESFAKESNAARNLLAQNLTRISGKTMQEASPALAALRSDRVAAGWLQACSNASKTEVTSFNGNRFELYHVDKSRFDNCLGHFASAGDATAAFTRQQGAGAGMALATGFTLLLPFALWLAAGTRRFEDAFKSTPTAKPNGPT
jgi:hypothetical protein